ncbi:hypothetical protein D3C81_1883970 [compost metagenome]
MGKPDGIPLINHIHRSQQTALLTDSRHDAVAVPISRPHSSVICSFTGMIGEYHRLPIQRHHPHMLLVAVNARLKAGGAVVALVHGFHIGVRLQIHTRLLHHILPKPG